MGGDRVEERGLDFENLITLLDLFAKCSTNSITNGSFMIDFFFPFFFGIRIS